MNTAKAQVYIPTRSRLIGSVLTLVYIPFVLNGCAAKPVKVLPPEIIKVPVFMPLPADCGDLPVVSLPDESSAADVMDQLRAALDAAEDQIQRCFDTSNPNGT